MENIFIKPLYAFFIFVQFPCSKQQESEVLEQIIDASSRIN